MDYNIKENELMERLSEKEKECELLKKELQKYYDLEEQGLLLKLPCRIGDKFYSIERIAHSDTDEDCSFVSEKNFPDIILMINKFGTKYFLTETEAENKLRDLLEEESAKRK